jgi:hypothetical protein
MFVIFSVKHWFVCLFLVIKMYSIIREHKKPLQFVSKHTLLAAQNSEMSEGKPHSIKHASQRLRYQ